MKIEARSMGIAFAILVASALAISAVKVKAQSSVVNPTGSCGVVFNLTNSVQAIQQYAINAIDDESLNGLGMLNFDTMTASMSVTSLVVSGGASSLVERTGTNAPMIFAEHAAIPGAKVVTVTYGGGNLVFNMLPVNSNGTYLIQGVSFGATGVCQKI